MQLRMMILFHQMPRRPPATNSTITVEHRNQQIEVNLCHFCGNLEWFCPSFFSSEESLPLMETLDVFVPVFSLKWELCLTRWWWPLLRWRWRSTPSFGVFSPPFCRSFTHNQDHFKFSAVANNMIEQCLKRLCRQFGCVLGFVGLADKLGLKKWNKLINDD